MSKPLTDLELLEQLCEEPYRSRLGEKAEGAFPAWLEEGRPLTQKMRAWIRNTAESLGIQVAPSENLFSRLSPGEQERQRERAAKFAPKLPWEK